ncbi:two-component system response regulator GlrR [Chitinivorax tropicus]|uniref:Two-component system response regulator GlrR n=1 Tax=Chitinivorax tropicus TaxID=714531 RepID=A0A840MG30_9PROT|nr:sigma 54-interacting transcriptional regulator [Chitinivorax tropicus]MBB5018204.1 two-component system response regulator GlrR [Chitinivorax tropicus]
MSAAKILIVDDDADLLRLLNLRLASAGHEVVAASSGEEALAAVATNRPSLIITDLRMAGMDGMALFDVVHRTHPGLPVIILTAHGSIPDAVAATRRGVFGYLAKPVDGKVLLDEVAQALRAAAPAVEGPHAAAFGDAIQTRNPAMQDVLTKAALVAQGDASILIQGESGTGKEVLARAIHAASHRRDQPFIAINCGAIPEHLLESELFGHVKGAFTGAQRDHAGLFQAAHGGTLLLDEIGDMPLSLQVKLLRVLQDRQVRPVGAVKLVDIDVRVISATHRDLQMAIRDNAFREDLFYRLNVVSLTLPPLDKRREDIPLLAGHFLQNLAPRYRKDINGFSPEAIELLVTNSWPGNVRQLQNIVEQAVALCTTSVISAASVEMVLSRQGEGIASFEEARRGFERDYLVQLLKITNGSVTQAARLAKRNRTEFYKLLERHELDPASFKDDK